MSQSISIPDDLYHHLTEQAQKSQTPLDILVTRLLEKALAPPPGRPPRPLLYGEFHGPRLSCEEDFRLAEWHLQDQSIDGP